ncbi:ankyrin repeat-containing domain protein [Coniochaeta sp. 2T2.1]|nr:ankyrin repeat-containing domain protein [Coniochaeta sp. 2T2.1]
MGRLSQVKNRLLGKSKPDGGSKGSSGVSSPSATPPTAPVLPSVSAPASASEIPSDPIIAHPPPKQIVLSAPQHRNAIPPSPDPQPAPPTASNPATSPSHDVDPWGTAYKIFQEREPELTADYAKHLASVQGDPAASTDLSVPRSVESIVTQLLEDREKKQWRVSLLGRDIKIREQAEKLAKFLLWSDSIVKDALSAQPYAQLAWSGLLTSGATQNEAMLKGFNSIGDVQVYWRICEETYLQSEHRQHYQRLVEPLAKLYSYIIEYQARVICHLSRAQLSRAWQSVAGWKDWDRAAEIDKLSKDCSGCIVQLNEGEIRERWKCQLQDIQQSRTILGEIRGILERGGRQTQRIYEDQKERALLQDLASDYEGDKNFNPQKVEGTCEWFLNDDRFRKWRDSNTSSLLWVSAGPGCGKSVLSRALIDEHRLSTKVTTSTVCHFFFKDGDDRRMYSTNALCAILHQLFAQDPTGSLIGGALPSHKNYGEKLTQNFSELWRILLECVRSSDTGEVVCILDALDECDRNSREELINKLKDFYCQPHHLSHSSSKLKFLITSRPYDDLEAYFGNFLTTKYLRFDGDDKSADIGREINLVIDERVNQVMVTFAADDRHKISERLKSMENRTYLWLYLIFDIVKENLSRYGKRSGIERLLSDIPSQVSEAYEKILSRSQDEVQTDILLRIILAAAQPLSLDDANVALTLALQEQRFASFAAVKSELWPRDNFRSIVKNLCGLFISVYDSKLSFIHQTAREFLTNPERQRKWEGRLNMPKSHSTMSLVCLHYLLLPDLATSDEEHSFLPYAAIHWPLHHISQEDVIADQSRKDARMLCNVVGEARVWAPNYLQRRYFVWQSWTDLALASYLGLRLVVEDILAKEKIDVNAQCGGHGTALCIASKGGYKEIVEMLLGKGADVNARGVYYGTALQAASAGGHKEVAEILLGKGADVNARGGRHSTALYEASARGHKEVVEMLLGKGADINAEGGKFGTALQAASAGGHKEVAEMLLGKGADVNAQGEYYGTALQAASAGGHKEVAEILLGKGADVNARGEYYGTALYEASARGHKEVVEMLLGKGADINAQGGEFGTALQAASAGGHKEVVEMLLGKGADINAQGGEGHKEVVEMLLGKGADVNTEGGKFGTALQAASAGGHKEVAEILLGKGADVNARGGQHSTALYEASARGHKEVVEMLLGKGADVNTEGGKFGTALQAASAGGHKEVAEILLGKGADVNARGGQHSTALYEASAGGHKEVVEMLLGKGADVNAEGGYYGTALQAASAGGHKEVVQILLDYHAE